MGLFAREEWLGVMVCYRWVGVCSPTLYHCTVLTVVIDHH